MLAFEEQFTEGGLLPGLTLLHFGTDINGSHVYRDWAVGGWGAGGLGHTNGATLLIGAYARPATQDTALEGGIAHEAGHCLFFTHAPIAAGGSAPKHQNQNDCICIMDYCGCFGDFCGRCLLKLRGWKVQRANGDGGA